MSGDELLAAAKKFEKSLLNFFWRQNVSFDEGADYVQETFLRLWKYRKKYKQTAKLSTFLFMIARQVRIDALREETRRVAREKRWSEEREVPETGGSGALDAREDVRWALAKLSEPLREVVELAIFQDLPYAEVGEILGIPVGTVKSRMSNALKKLKEIFNDEGSERNAQ